MGRLLVYIPTFDRPGLLRTQLEALRPQILSNHEKVRVIVADNASPSIESQGLADEYRSQNWLEWISRPNNLGGNANILLGFTYQRPDEYLWILSDDTKVTECAVELLLNLVELEPDLISVSPVQVSGAEPKVMTWSGSSIEYVATETAWGLISSAIYSPNAFGPYASEGFFFHNSSFPHLGILLSSLRGRGALTLEWISRTDVHGENLGKGSTDYSLAVCGFPHLFTLADKTHQKRMVGNWLKRYSAAFAYYAPRHPLSSLVTSRLIERSGFKARALSVFGSFEAWLRLTAIGKHLERIVENSPRLLKRINRSGRLLFRRT